MPRTYNRKFKLTWHKHSQRWKRVYLGKTYYLKTKCNGKSDIQGYQLALNEWEALKQKIDREFESQPVGVRLATNYSAFPDELPESVLIQPDNATIDDLAASFVAEFKHRAETGDCGITTFRENRDCLADFQGYAKKYQRKLASEIDEHLLKCYRDKQRELVQQTSISAYTAKKRLYCLKRFIEWAYKHRYLSEFPRNVDRHFSKVVKLPDPSPNPFTVKEIRAIWKASITKGKFSRKSYKTSLFILLGLNCGYRSGDIAKLKHSHLRKENGIYIIDRKREKTGSPQVHALWPLTAKLLFDEMTDPKESDFMLLDERGGMLVTENIEGVTAINDCIGRCFNRVKSKAKITGKGTGHSSLRDTGADAIKKQFPAYPQIVSQYLGHKATGMQTHYTREHYETLFASLEWLDEHFKLTL